MKKIASFDHGHMMLIGIMLALEGKFKPLILTWRSFEATDVGEQVSWAESLDPMFAEECRDICAIPASARLRWMDVYSMW